MKEDEWMLKLMWAVHNHPAIEYLQGHSFVGRMLEVEKMVLFEMSKCYMLKDILASLKKKDPKNSSSVKTNK